MAELLGADVHQKVFAIGIFAIEALNGVLHRRRELAIGTAELLEQHIAEGRIGFVDTDGVHKLLDVMIHGGLWGGATKVFINLSGPGTFLISGPSRCDPGWLHPSRGVRSLRRSSATAKQPAPLSASAENPP